MLGQGHSAQEFGAVPQLKLGPFAAPSAKPLTDFPSPGEPRAQPSPGVSLVQIPWEGWDKAPLSLGKPGDRFSNLPRLRLPSPLLKADQEAWGS